MQQKISFKLHTLAMTFKWATSVEHIPKMFRAIAGFLEKEPDENFSLFDNSIPLNLNEKDMSSFQKATSEFPEVFELGKAQTKQGLNVIITIGQILSTVAIIFDLYANPIKPDLKEKYKNVKPLVGELHKIWGSHAQMNARALSQHYAHKDTKNAKTSLIKKLNASADLIEKKILPEIKVGPK